MTYCIVCATELRDGICPACGWVLEGDRAGAPRARDAAGVAVSSDAARSRPPATTHTAQTFFHAVPPLIDLMLDDEGHTYALSEAMGGKAASLARFGQEGFESSAMLGIESPLGLAMLADRSPLVVGGKGVAVNVTFPPQASAEALPTTRGHRTGWDVSCYALSPARDVLALAVPSEGAVKALTTDGFDESVLTADLPGNPTALAYSRDGRALGIGCYSGELCILDASTGLIEVLARPGSNEGVVALDVVPGGGWVAAYEDRRVLRWDGPSVAAEDVVDGDVSALAVDFLTGQIAAGSSQGYLYVWEPGLGELIAAQPAHSDRVARVHPLLDRGIMLSAARDGEVILLEIA